MAHAKAPAAHALERVGEITRLGQNGEIHFTTQRIQKVRTVQYKGGLVNV